MNHLKDLTGKRFGRLTVICRDTSNRNKRPYWICKCDCGNIKSIGGDSLKRGTTKSCGCLRKELNMNPQKYKRSSGKSRLYKIWWHMINRCQNQNDISYKNYGKKGIAVCQAWENYDSFADWALAHGYSDNKEIDRIDCGKGYYGENCRWVTRLENARNKKNTVYLDYLGKTYSLGELADKAHIEPKLFWQKLKRDKKSVKEIMREA